MPFLAKEIIDIPTKDILSWISDGPEYDQSKPLYTDATNPSNSISAARAKRLIKQLIRGFQEAGLKKGDTVLIHSFNNIFYPIIVLGIIGFGGVYISKAKFVISEPEILDRIKHAASECSIPPSRILILNSPDTSAPPDSQSWMTLLQHGEANWLSFNDLQISESTPAMLLFLSGTTGLPKAAILSHYNLVAQHTVTFEYRPRPYTLSRPIPLPMFHAATAPSTHISPLRSGHEQYIARRFEVNSYLDHIENYKITDLTLVPPMVTAIVSLPIDDSIKKRKLHHVKMAVGGAAPLDKAMQARHQALLPPDAPFTQIRAMTETSCYASLFYYPENDDTGSVGRFVPNLDVKLIDDYGNDVSGQGVRGELCVRGPTVIKSYVDVPRERDFDNDGYFRTGDVLRCEEDTGKWYIVDRKKELIKVRGFQVAPAELEGVLLEHDGVPDAAVIGLPSQEGDSELPRAYVVKKQDWMSNRLARYKRLEGGVKFVEAILKTLSGKIMKRVLREQARKEVGSKL
ncbi:acetyl-CoA synthetase-like protein [Lojkania enalia]|uniref:Acetyl-CoA synthetase-like protein n=1 Tax=Lojkania enalia TaxID=147567 RepID=A0A9P4TRY2_9PLEO|nr:acetyl-CoA synthetase-like protein [Didymosphaeria enalia]